MKTERHTNPFTAYRSLVKDEALQEYDRFAARHTPPVRKATEAEIRECASFFDVPAGFVDQHASKAPYPLGAVLLYLSFQAQVLLNERLDCAED